ncbi:hypothetical protein HEK616_78300 (plasmid) [Streptomyces nigrescens]|uniref:Secreted protein n=2 Tax=Streptomyces TaxID=1883 RepID=A0ABM8A6T3_STRNI|nr:hypothetical protein [Streptomyces nigrescens]MEE4418951.1 hypothetical protein [Streptomyces sp. DSM 41528]BDM74343.1 hypothetical protein HEK616_78300 [Streptomyces nigrescens]
MRKIGRIVSVALGAGALVLSAVGAASAEGWRSASHDPFGLGHRQCGAPSFSLLFPSRNDCRTFLFIDNERYTDAHRHYARFDFDQRLRSSNISGDLVNDLTGRGRGRR